MNPVALILYESHQTDCDHELLERCFIAMLIAGHWPGAKGFLTASDRKILPKQVGRWNPPSVKWNSAGFTPNLLPTSP